MVIWLPMFWMAAGICLFAGTHFVHAWRSREHDQLYLAFGALSLSVAVYMVVTALMQDPHLHIAARDLERMHLAVACMIYPIAIWFLSLYSRLRRWKATVTVAALAFGVMLVINYVRPYSLLYSSIREMDPLVLAWGEKVRQFGGQTTPTALVYYALTFLAFMWAFWRCGALWMNKDHRRAKPLLIYLLLQVIAVMHTEYITYSNQRALAWDALPFLGLVLLLSRSLTLELRRYAYDLQRSNLALRRENEARTRAQTHLEHAAYHDALTGLPNRRAMREFIDSGRAHVGPGYSALVVLDPERFRIINQALGHRVGDELIHDMGQHLKGTSAKPRLVARLDGDEFAVLLKNLPMSRDEAIVQAREDGLAISQDLATSIRLGTHDLAANVSAGITLISEHDRDSDALLREAYMALQAAKRNGPEHAEVFTEDMKAGADRSLKLENDLRLAVKNDALTIQFQPQINTKGDIVGAEALLRWAHPEYGPIEPEEFIGIAEDRGLIYQLGRQVLHKACTALASLDVAGTPFRMSVNISPWQLLLADFLDTVLEVLDETGVKPDRLTLEITESVFVHDVSDAICKIRELNALGIRVAIDDFGTGFASVASLKDLPVGEMKIDRTFINDMDTSSPDRLVSAMIAMGQALDLVIVAEGVETEAQRRRLTLMGCDVFQGYLFSQPLDLNDLRGRLDKAILT